MFMANVALAYIAMGVVVMYSYSIHSYGLCILRKVHARGGRTLLVTKANIVMAYTGTAFQSWSIQPLPI